MTTLICERCSSPFRARGKRKHTARYCSVKCYMPGYAAVNCERCGKEFTPRLNHGTLKKFCSMICSKPPRVERKCAGCGDEFSIWPSVAKIGKGATCSTACAAIVRSKRAGTLADRLARRVVRKDGCWGWIGPLDSHGYGILPRPGHPNRTIKAHRAAWEVADGSPPPPGMDVLHACDNRQCTRNDVRGTYEVGGRQLPMWGHLVLGTAADNLQDMARKGRHSFQTHPDRIKRGRDQSQARLSEEDVRVILGRLADGTATYVALAEEFGVSKSLIGAIKHRKRWAHVKL